MNDEKWVFFLYVAGLTPVATRALTNITAVCEDYIRGNYSIDVVDILLDPEVADREQIFAVPTLVRRTPRPVRKVIGDLSDSVKVMAGLDLYSA
jgi:circadian clock protein KaiB